MVPVLQDIYYCSSKILHPRVQTFKKGEFKKKKKLIIIRMSFVQHPVVAECCVLGLPDKDYGEAVCAIIVPKADAKVKGEEDLKPAISLEELCCWAKEKLAPYKVLEHVHLSLLPC